MTLLPPFTFVLFSFRVRPFNRLGAHGETAGGGVGPALREDLRRRGQGCGVNEKTLRGWMADDEAFKRDLAEARHAVFQAGMHRVEALTPEATDTLATLMGRKIPSTVPATSTLRPF